MSEIIQFNKFAKLHNGESVFFCKTDYLPKLFESLNSHWMPSVLISGNSDYAITDDMLSWVPLCIKRWFTQCVNTEHPMVTALPYGLENTEDCILAGHGKGHGRTFKVEAAENPPICDPHKLVYANFSVDTHPIRTAVNKLCEELPFVTTSVSRSHAETNSRPYDEFIKDIVEHKMVVCPRGNAAAETHRFWETLYMNRVPIIKRNKGNSFFTELPVIVLEDWEQLANLEFLESEWEKVKDNSREMLKMSYWEKLILNECR